MSFRGLFRPGQGFQPFRVLRRDSGLTATGRPRTAKLQPHGEILGIISQDTPKATDQSKQRGSPITHTIVQRGTENRAADNDVLELLIDPYSDKEAKPRRFLVHGDPKEPGDIGHFLVYTVEERDDLQ